MSPCPSRCVCSTEELIKQHQLALASLPERNKPEITNGLKTITTILTITKCLKCTCAKHTLLGIAGCVQPFVCMWDRANVLSGSCTVSRRVSHPTEPDIPLHCTCPCILQCLQKIKTFFYIADLGVFPSLIFSAFTHEPVSILPPGSLCGGKWYFLLGSGQKIMLEIPSGVNLCPQIQNKNRPDT